MGINEIKNHHLIMILGLTAAISSTVSCAAEPVKTNASIDLLVDAKSCVVSVNGQSKALALSADCKLVESSKMGSTSKVTSMYFDDIQADVYMIVGNSLQEHPDFPFVASRDDCGSATQAVIVSKDNSIRLSSVSTPVVVCAKLGIDEKDYWIASH